MTKISKFLNSFFFVSIWLICTSYFEKYWDFFHSEYIYLKGRVIFDFEFWFFLKKILLGFDIGYYIEELFRFLSYELPKESIKFLPIYFFIRYLWLKRTNKNNKL